MSIFRRSASTPASTAANMPDPDTDPQAFDAWLDKLPKNSTGSGITNTGVMHDVQNNPGTGGGRQVSNGRVNRNQG